MVKNRIYIDGKDYTEFTRGLDELTESYQLKEDGTIEIGQTSTITMHGAGYDYWKAIFFDDSCKSIDREYKVRIKVESCQEDLDFIIKSQGVTIDYSNCLIKMNLNTENEKDQQIEILRKTYFWDEDYNFIKEYFAKNRIPKMLYVKELTYLSKAIIYLYVVVAGPFVTLVSVWAAVINTIIDFINTLGANLSKLHYEKFEDEIEDDIKGAGECTTVYYLIDIFNFWCNEAGLKFQSSILNNEPYSNMALWGQQIKKGIETTEANKYSFDKANAPNYSALELLNLLAPVFNAKWEIIEGTLYFERHDFFDTTKKTVLNIETELRQGRLSDGLQFNFDASENIARLRAEYSADSIDTQGNRNIFDFYSNVIDYNQGLTHKNRKGEYFPRIQFGAVRFTNDINVNRFNSYMWESGRFLFFKLGDLDYSHAVVLTNDTAQLPKLIVVDQNTSRDHYGTKFRFAVKKEIKPGKIKGFLLDEVGVWEYNMPMWLNNELHPGQNLLDRFHYIENPDLKNKRFVEIQSLNWRPDNFCEAVRMLRGNKLNIKVTSLNGDGHVGAFIIDYGKCSIQLNQIKFKCNDIS